MMKKFLAVILVLSLCLLLLPDPGHCARINWGGTDRRIQLGRQLAYDLIYTGANRGGVSTIASTVTPLEPAHIAFGLLRIADGSPGARELPDGVRGKTITIELIAADAADPTYTIADDTSGAITKTGWETITFDTSHDRVTLLWLDDTYGWVITSADGVTITY